MTIKPVSYANGKGWLVVKWTNGTSVPAVPQFLHVELIKTENGRDYFTIIEGMQKKTMKLLLNEYRCMNRICLMEIPQNQK